MNPLDLTGPDFLSLYAVLAAAAVVIGFVLRRLVEGFGGSDAAISSSLAPCEVAYLRGGFSAVAEATLATLIRRGVITAEDTSKWLVRAAQAQAVASNNWLEHECLTGLDWDPSSPGEAVRDRVSLVGSRLVEPLERRGLAFSAEQRRSIGLAFCLPVIAVLALGIAKIAVGLSRARPVSILVFFCLVTAAGVVMMLRSAPRATPAGREALRRARARNEALRETASRRTANLSPDDVAMAVGLFGLEAVGDPAMLALRRKLHPPQTATSSCGSGSSCSSGSSSGSSCGSGCGGGGGCGGCGG